jgi:hypothetical protein
MVYRLSYFDNGSETQVFAIAPAIRRTTVPRAAERGVAGPAAAVGHTVLVFLYNSTNACISCAEHVHVIAGSFSGSMQTAMCQV